MIGIPSLLKWSWKWQNPESRTNENEIMNANCTLIQINLSADWFRFLFVIWLNQCGRCVYNPHSKYVPSSMEWEWNRKKNDTKPQNALTWTCTKDIGQNTGVTNQRWPWNTDNWEASQACGARSILHNNGMPHNMFQIRR